MRTLLLSVLVLSTQLFGRDMARMADIVEYVEEGTLVVFDIDNTLIKTTHQLGSSKWGYHIADSLMAQGWDQDAAWAESCSRLYCIHRFARMEPVEEETPEIIAYLQAQGIAIIGLTARNPEASFYTPSQLLELEIDLAQTAPAPGSFTLPLPAKPYYNKGIIYATQDESKGVVLTSFLQHTGLNPAKVVFVDDRAVHITSMEKSMAEHNIECVAVRYGGADKAFEEFDAAVADIQWRTFGYILSDDEADSR